MTLPSTYFDVLVKRDPEMVMYVRKDIKSLQGTQQVPFGSTDDYSQYFEKYISSVTKKVIEYAQNQIYPMGVSSPMEAEKLVNQFYDSEDYKSFMYCKQADYLTLTNFELFGKKSFHISSNLVEHLSQTNLEVDSELLRMPFDSCLFVYGSKTAIRAFHAFDIHEEVIDYSTPISVFAHSRPAEGGEKKIVFACWHANHKHSYSFVKRELLIRKNWSITQILKTDWDDIYSYSETNEPEEVPISELVLGKKNGDAIFYEKGLMFFRILINTILYLSSNQPDIVTRFSPYLNLQNRLKSLKSKSKINKITKQLAQSSQLDYSEVGGNLSPIIVDKIPSFGSSSSQVFVGKFVKRFIVRGHWRNQPCGHNRSEKTLVWIKPYYKGPEMAELVNKPYLVK